MNIERHTWNFSFSWTVTVSSSPHFQESIINYLASNFFSFCLSSVLVLPLWKAMEKRLGVKPSPASWILPGYCWQTSVKPLRSLYLLYTFFCFSSLWLSTGIFFFFFFWDLRFNLFCPTPSKQSASWIPGLVLKTYQKTESDLLTGMVGVCLLGLFCFGIKMWIGFFSYKGELVFILSFYRGTLTKTEQTFQNWVD